MQRKIDEIVEKRERVWLELRQLEVDHPEYEKVWLDVYNEVRIEAYLDKYIPDEDQFNDYAKVTLNELIEKGVKAKEEVEIQKSLEDIYVDRESLKYYTLKRNTERELTDNIRHLQGDNSFPDKK
jgi:hypothetical protein